MRCIILRKTKPALVIRGCQCGFVQLSHEKCDDAQAVSREHQKISDMDDGSVSQSC
nr:MAG TPA: hypothetical protein [Caudoviricetes sp.]